MRLDIGPKSEELLPAIKSAGTCMERTYGCFEWKTLPQALVPLQRCSKRAFR